jgi:hypothetical protein
VVYAWIFQLDAGGFMKVSYDLTFMNDSAPFSGNISEIYFRPISLLDSSLKYFEETFPHSKIFHSILRGDLTHMVKKLQEMLDFPSDTSHSLDAFGDYLCDLSWLGVDHVVLVVGLANEPGDLDKYMIIDTLSWTVNMLNLERARKLSVLVLL